MHSPDNHALMHDADWLVVQLNRFQLLLPRSDTVIFAPIEGAPREATRQCGTLTHEQTSHPVFSLDANLRLQPSGDDHCRDAILLRAPTHSFGLACQGLSKLQTTPAPRYKVPTCMRGRRQPFEQFILLHGRPAPLTSAEALAELLQQLDATLIAETTEIAPKVARNYQQELA